MQQQEIRENPDIIDVSEFITVPTAAKMLSLSAPHVYRMTKRGEFPGIVHFGRAIRIRKKEFREWMDARCKGA